MRILLIQPPVEHMIPTMIPEPVERGRGYSPPLGLLYLASSLEDAGWTDVAVVDAQAEELDYATLADRIRRFKPDLVGISAMTFTLLDVLRTASVAKQQCPGCRVVLGGPHPTIYGAPTLRSHAQVDFLLRGEGEASLPQLAAAMRDGAALDAVPGLTFRRGRDVVENPIPPGATPLDRLPFPARHLLDVRRYTSVLSHRRPVTTMISSRGCPYACRFCYRPSYDREYRTRSAGNVVDEMAACRRMGIEEVFFYDDTFNLDRERVLAICREIRRRNLDMPWDVRVRLDRLDPDLLSEMRRAGCCRLHLGVESGSQRLLQQMRKHINLGDVQQVFDAARRAGIETLAYFMLGFPGETAAEIGQSIDWAVRLNADYAQFAIVIPFPDTTLYADWRAAHGNRTDPWAEFAAAPTSGFRPPYCQQTLPEPELQHLLQVAYRRFYGRPAYVIRHLRRIRSWSNLVAAGLAGWRILKPASWS